MKRLQLSNIRTLLVAIVAFTVAGGHGILLAAPELRTYRFVDGDERLFRFAGGLIGLNVSARLEGSFDIEVQADGTSTISRFDVRLIDLLDEGSIGPGWLDGEPLADRLFVPPLGLAGTYSGASIQLGGSSHIELEGPTTQLDLTHISARLADVRISSRPPTFLDNPQFSTDAPGLRVWLVPEPGTALLMSSFLVISAVRRRRNAKR